MPDLCRLSSAVGQRAVKPLMRRFESGRRLQSRARLRESLSGRTHAMGQEYAHAIKPGGRIFLYHTGCNAGIFIYRFSSAGRAPVSKTGSAGSSPASGANLPGRPEKLAYMIFSSRSVLCRVGIFISFFGRPYRMLKACPYCGRIHDKQFDCGKRPTFGRYQQQDAFRSTQAWQRKRAWIRERDMHLCRWCLTLGRLSYTNLSVHHIEPLHEAWGERLEDSNLITLCSPCHEQAEAGKISRAALHELTHTPPQLSPRPRRDKF